MNSMRTVGIFMLCASILLFGCKASNTVKGTGIGAAAGGVVGGIIGKQAGNTAAGIIIGAAIGGTAGALIGRYMDRQAEEMRRDLENAKVERVGEGIKITFASGILFDVDKSNLRDASRSEIKRLATILKKYPDTKVEVQGYTDSDGTAEYNQKLSERRADAVASYAKDAGVAGSRFNTVGLGETHPVASNGTTDGKQSNRRVEIAIYANDKLKEMAQDGKL